MAHAEEQTFKVIHPFHPLCECEFKLASVYQTWGENRVYFHDENQRLRAIPADWTSLATQDPFIILAAGRSWFRATDLLELVQMIHWRECGV
ncbi:MAG: hypothetical protein JXA73_05240 [Acidobacteria bacterium]|nr:hypothetical protein [Acidobacteriota bacterium]